MGKLGISMDQKSLAGYRAVEGEIVRLNDLSERCRRCALKTVRETAAGPGLLWPDQCDDENHHHN